jgi:hypothetical protein
MAAVVPGRTFHEWQASQPQSVRSGTDDPVFGHSSMIGRNSASTCTTNPRLTWVCGRLDDLARADRLEHSFLGQRPSGRASRPAGITGRQPGSRSPSRSRSPKGARTKPKMRKFCRSRRVRGSRAGSCRMAESARTKPVVPGFCRSCPTRSLRSSRSPTAESARTKPKMRKPGKSCRLLPRAMSLGLMKMRKRSQRCAEYAKHEHYV